MRKIYGFLVLMVVVAGSLRPAPVLAHDSKEVFSVSGSTTSGGIIYLRVADASGVPLETASPTFSNGDAAVVVRNALVAALSPPSLGITAAGTAGNRIEVTYAPGTHLRFLLSSDNVTYTELTVTTPVVVRGVTFTPVSMPLTNGAGGVSAPAFDVWVLLAVVLLVGAGGWLMFKRAEFGRAA